jgi:Pentapeptide repeats (8 copies)
LNRHLSQLLYLLLILLLLSSCAASTVKNAEKQGATLLSAEDIFDLSSGNTLRLISSDFDAHVYFSQDGSLSASSIFNNNLDYGSWDIKSEDKLCIKFKIWYFGDVNCYSIYKDVGKDQYLFFTDNGALAYAATVSAGNSQHLKIKTKKNKKAVYVRGAMNQGQEVDRPASAVRRPAPVQAVTNSGSRSSQEEVKQTVTSMAQNCPGCNFENVDLRKANLIGANLKGANLQGADLSRANLRRANLEGADLSGATLLSTNLPGANLKGADLSGADLTGSNLIQADFTDADMKGSILDNTLQEGAKGLQ